MDQWELRGAGPLAESRRQPLAIVIPGCNTSVRVVICRYEDKFEVVIVARDRRSQSILDGLDYINPKVCSQLRTRLLDTLGGSRYSHCARERVFQCKDCESSHEIHKTEADFKSFMKNNGREQWGHKIIATIGKPLCFFKYFSQFFHQKTDSRSQ